MSDNNNNEAQDLELEEEDKPLTAEDILNKPFYTIEMDPPRNPAPPPLSNNYRNTLSDLLLNVRVKSPPRFQNRTLRRHLAAIDWTDRASMEAFEAALKTGPHNSLCLAHGRNPLIKYKEISYPSFRSFRRKAKSCRDDPRIRSKLNGIPIPVSSLRNNRASIALQRNFHFLFVSITIIAIFS